MQFSLDPRSVRCRGYAVPLSMESPVPEAGPIRKASVSNHYEDELLEVRSTLMWFTLGAQLTSHVKVGSSFWLGSNPYRTPPF